MAKIIEFKSRGDNKLYRYAGTAVSYIDQGNRPAAVHYIKRLPKEIRTTVARLVDEEIEKRKNIPKE